MKSLRTLFLPAILLVPSLSVLAQTPPTSNPPAPLKIMDPKADPTFAVASIKLSPSGAGNKAIRVIGHQLSGMNQNVNNLIAFSYGVHLSQVSGGPPWLASENFDVLAETDGEGQPSEQQWRIMLQKLLADRFKLAFHREKKEMSVYTLSVAKGGPKLMVSTDDPNGFPSGRFRLGNLVGRNAGMSDLAFMLQDSLLDRPVLDQTGLAGRFDFTLDWTPDDQPPADPDKAPPDLYAAIQQELGLTLKSTKAPADVIVIDHIQQPSPN